MNKLPTSSAVDVGGQVPEAAGEVAVQVQCLQTLRSRRRWGGLQAVIASTVCRPSPVSAPSDQLKVPYGRNAAPGVDHLGQPRYAGSIATSEVITAWPRCGWG